MVISDRDVLDAVANHVNGLLHFKAISSEGSSGLTIWINYLLGVPGKQDAIVFMDDDVLRVETFTVGSGNLDRTKSVKVELADPDMFPKITAILREHWRI